MGFGRVKSSALHRRRTSRFLRTGCAYADNEIVTANVSRPVQIFAVLGVVGALGFAALNLMGGSSTASTTPAPIVQPTAPTTPAPRPVTPTRRQTVSGETRSGFPLSIDSALRRKKVVVVAVYMPRAGVDLVVRREAQQASARAGAAFVAVRATNERVVRPLVAKVGLLSQPAVLVVRRPGVVTAKLGVTDRRTIQQAVAQARR